MNKNFKKEKMGTEYGRKRQEEEKAGGQKNNISTDISVHKNL